jgi:hypothetical protein
MKGRIVLLIAVKELWFTFAYKWNRIPVSFCAARVCTPSFHHNQEKSDADTTSCDGWQYYGEPSQPADGMKNMLLAASASMSLFAAAPVVTAAAAGLVDGTSKPGTISSL